MIRAAVKKHVHTNIVFKLSGSVHELSCVQSERKEENNTVRRYGEDSKNVKSFSSHQAYRSTPICVSLAS